MFRASANLLWDSGPNTVGKNGQPNVNLKKIWVDAAVAGLAVNDEVQIMDRDDQTAPFGEIVKVLQIESEYIIVDRDLQGQYLKDNGACIGKVVDSDDPTFVPFYEADTADVELLFSQAFVEVKFRSEGSGPCPHLKVMAVNSNDENGDIGYAGNWSYLGKAAYRPNYFHLIGAHSNAAHAFGHTPTPNHRENVCYVYYDELENDPDAASHMTQAVRGTVAHELTHQFDDDPEYVGFHCRNNGVAPAVPENTRCVMHEISDFGAPTAWCRPHVYTVRDEADAQTEP